MVLRTNKTTDNDGRQLWSKNRTAVIKHMNKKHNVFPCKYLLANKAPSPISLFYKNLYISNNNKEMQKKKEKKGTFFYFHQSTEQAY